MAKQKLSSRERVMAAIHHQLVDHVPLCFNGLCHGGVRFVDRLHTDPYEKAQFYLDLGVDTAISIRPPTFSSADFETREWREHMPDDDRPLLFKEYVTPRGNLRQVVRKTDDYPESIPLFSDHNVPPGRSQQYLVTDEGDLDKLGCILSPPRGQELDRFHEQAKAAKAFCEDREILVSAYSQGVGDPLIWLSGVTPLLIAALENPGFMQRYVSIVSDWNRKVMEISLDAGAELIVRRGWYESTDFWSPQRNETSTR